MKQTHITNTILSTQQERHVFDPSVDRNRLLMHHQIINYYYNNNGNYYSNEDATMNMRYFSIIMLWVGTFLLCVLTLFFQNDDNGNYYYNDNGLITRI